MLSGIIIWKEDFQMTWQHFALLVLTAALFEVGTSGPIAGKNVIRIVQVRYNDCQLC